MGLIDWLIRRDMLAGQELTTRENVVLWPDADRDLQQNASEQ